MGEIVLSDADLLLARRFAALLPRPLGQEDTERLERVLHRRPLPLDADVLDAIECAWHAAKAADARRVVVRDQLLDAILGHLQRRGDGQLSQLVARIIGVVRGNDGGRIEESRLEADVAAFAAMDLGRGKQKSPGFFREAKILVDSASGQLRRLAEWMPNASTEIHRSRIQEVWQEMLEQQTPLTPEEIEQVLAHAEREDQAIRLVFFATRSKRSSKELFDDFRTQVNRQELRAHPWIVGDTKSQT